MEFFAGGNKLPSKYMRKVTSTETFKERMDLLRTAERRICILMKARSWARAHGMDPSELGLHLNFFSEEQIIGWCADPREARKTLSQDTLRIKKAFDAMRKKSRLSVRLSKASAVP